MRKFTRLNDPLLASLPPPFKGVVRRALQTLCSIFGPELDPEVQGFVVFIEPVDDLLKINAAIARNMDTALEGVFRDGYCLIGVVLWGNSGEGVTIVCPDQPGYAVGAAQIMRSHIKGGADGRKS
mgnify:CR=1 FL=1